MKKQLLWVVFAGMLLVVMGILGTGVRAQQEIVFGVIPLEDARTMYTKFKPLADYLTAQTGVTFTLRVGKDYQATADEMGNGTAQIAYLTPTVYPKSERQNPDAKITPIARFLKSGAGTHKSYIIVPSDSPVQTVAELKGKKFAFGSKDSTASHLMPRSMLVAAGIDIDKDLAGYEYLGSHTNVVKAVAAKTHDAGGLNDGVAEKFIAEGGAVRVIAKSSDIPEFPICVNKSLSPAMVEMIRVALFKLNDKSPASVAVLTAMDPKYNGVEVAKSEDYDVIRAMIQKLYGDDFYKK